MKQWLISMLLLFSVAASAEDNEVAVMENSAGGRIVLTQKECPVANSSDFRLAYTWSSDLQFYGCWKIQKNNKFVDVIWITPDGESHYRVYNSDNFKLAKSI
jgi:hypothetical protein